MNYNSLHRKQRYGIRKFAIGAASVVIGTVVFGVNPVLAQEQANAAGASTETVESGQGQGLSELPKEVSSGDLEHLDKDLAGKLAAAQDNGVEVDQDHLKKMRVQNQKLHPLRKPLQKKQIRKQNQRIRELFLVTITQEI
ncbi:Gram-positive signal peptide protein, YSIRK family [Streptococcus oralis SK255]|uniref:Gram-positive signal peptide protein, YSIRK family n=1 Tax=Streptococcus oralis SK255 TaxID=1005704 RepID=F5VU12_STROR|nr:Gram-positive signal peptide protein, YSIRK family [Streptococcus oralis SK255]